MTSDEHSRIELLCAIAQDILPEMIDGTVDVYLGDEELRDIDREFAEWPRRHQTPYCVFYEPPNEEDDEYDGGTHGMLSFSFDDDGVDCVDLQVYRLASGEIHLTVRPQV
jgi:hypothetical protein